MAVHRILHAVTHTGQLELPEGWQQGRALFGGLVAAFLLKSVLQKVDTQAQVRTLNIQFVAPALPGPAHCEAEILRQGKSVIQAQSRCIQNGQVVALLTVSLAHTRESRFNLNQVERPVFREPKPHRAAPYIPGVMPDFMAHYEVIFGHGGLPYSGASEPGLGGWVRERDQDDQFSVLSLVAMTDVWPPGVLPMMTSPAAASSLSWTLEILRPLTGYTAASWWQYLSEVEYVADGYEHSRARLWDEQGQLVVLSRQCVTVFA